MSAGEPNWVKLYQMGKLPDNQRHRIPFLRELDKKNKNTQTPETTTQTPETTTQTPETTTQTPETTTQTPETTTQTPDFKCNICGIIAKSAAGLKSHSRKHN